MLHTYFFQKISEIEISKNECRAWCCSEIERMSQKCGIMGKFMNFYFPITKGQLISKPIYDLLTSQKNQTDEFDLFAVKSKKANK